MRAARPDTLETMDAAVDARQPADSELAVVFRGDGEPKTPAALVGSLADIESRGGLQVDSYSLGGTVERLEQTMAQMLGKEAAAFMPTGTLANHLAIRKLCGTRPRAVVQEQSHLYNDTGDCVTQLSNINLVPLAKDQAYFGLDELRLAVDRSETGRVANPIGAVMIESPVRRQAGRIMPYDEMAAVTSFCAGKGIPTHLDGARLYMMSAATGISPETYAALFDTAYVSLYKYFGAPYGGILAGTSAFIEGLYHDRRMFGGGLASAYMSAALALKGIQGFEARFGEAMNKAAELFERLNALPGLDVGRYENGSNIFPVELDARVDFERFALALKARWVFVYPGETERGRIHLTVNTTVLRRSNDDLFEAFEYALSRGVASRA